MEDKKILFIAHRLTMGGAQKMFTFVINLCSRYFANCELLLLYKDDIEMDLSNNVKYIDNGIFYNERKKIF